MSTPSAMMFEANWPFKKNCLTPWTMGFPLVNHGESEDLPIFGPLLHCGSRSKAADASGAAGKRSLRPRGQSCSSCIARGRPRQRDLRGMGWKEGTKSQQNAPSNINIHAVTILKVIWHADFVGFSKNGSTKSSINWVKSKDAFSVLQADCPASLAAATCQNGLDKWQLENWRTSVVTIVISVSSR